MVDDVPFWGASVGSASGAEAVWVEGFGVVAVRMLEVGL